MWVKNKIRECSAMKPEARKNVDDKGEMAYGWAKGREPGGARTSPQDGSTAIDSNYESSNP
jgi:hypothetical protein